MKTLLSSIALSFLVASPVIATPVMAADMPVKARPAPPVAALYTWNGFYIGGHFGYGWSDIDWVDTGGSNLSIRATAL